MNLRQRLPYLGDIVVYYDGVHHYPNYRICIASWDGRRKLTFKLRQLDAHGKDVGELVEYDLLAAMDNWYYVKIAPETNGTRVFF